MIAVKRLRTLESKLTTVLNSGEGIGQKGIEWLPDVNKQLQFFCIA